MTKKKRSNPYVLILLSFFIVIMVGTILLWLPFSAKEGHFKFIDSLFMATSAVCVTGLSSINVASEFTLFGKIVILTLIEIGGLSFLTIIVFFTSLISSKLKISQTFLMREALNQNSAKGIIGLIRLIVVTALTIQILGIIGCYFIIEDMIPGLSKQEILGYSVFHTISAFNNAGFDTFGPDSLIPYADNVWFNVITMALIILGGLGFVVIHEVLFKHKWRKFSLHTKIVLVTTTALLVIGALLIKVTMGDNMTWLQSAFLSVSTRTAGFASYDMGKLNDSTFIIVIVLMLIGASPCSTGGGIKTTTFFLAIVTIISFATGKKPVAFKRKISESLVTKTFSLVTLAILFVTTMVCILTITEAGKGFAMSDIVFEVVSGFGTVGFSTGITSSLSPLGKFLISLTMYCGRLGPLTIISLLNSNWIFDKSSGVKYIEENVLIG